MTEKEYRAFIIGVALGDGNLSNPNGRAVRLRITCDNKYPGIQNEISVALQKLFPLNKVAVVHRTDNCVDISLYSNKLEDLLPWKTNAGSKHTQQAHVPPWIFSDDIYIKSCLRGLILTDGSIYTDRGYRMVNICTNIKPLAQDILQMSELLNTPGTLSVTTQPSGKHKYTIRFAKHAQKVIQILKISKK